MFSIINPLVDGLWRKPNLFEFLIHNLINSLILMHKIRTRGAMSSQRRSSNIAEI